MTDAQNQMKAALREWIVEHAERPIAGGLRNDTPILEQRVISSLQVMELLVFIEKLTGKGPNLTQLQPHAFRSIDTIFATFFDDVHSHDSVTAK